jgi:anti-anti-sigma regulatory factor
MTSFLNPVQEERCLFITCEGEMRIAELLELHQQLTRILAKHSLRRVLLDVTCANYVSTALELFMFASAVSSSLPRGTRMALIVRPGQARHAKVLAEFMRRGGTLLTNFLDPEKAEAWLKNGICPVTARSRSTRNQFSESGKLVKAQEETVIS